jgi:trans-aconitate methyltransferase
MGDPQVLDDQRSAFGRVAELYDRARPSYPPAVIDAVIEFAGLTAQDRIVEVGAGTGKATVLLAERGVGVLALEPSHEMAEVARANCRRYPDVEILEVEFERWRPRERLPALLCAAAWHWICPEVRYHRAHDALLSGGTLAAIWTFPEWQRCALRRRLTEAYRSTAPQLAADFPMHPGSEPTSLAGDWFAEIRGHEGFTAPMVRTQYWWQEYTSAGYVELIQTHQDHILLPDAERSELIAAVGRAIDRAGGVMRLPFGTRICLARRC